MANQWTREQQEVIVSRNKDMLVSAAAGSGKTAVLVERILTRLMDEEKPVDIDRLLVVTFTRAAASEMKERIEQALEERSSQMPESVHLQRQLSLIHQAQITTIHSFCLEVIRNHFHTIGQDPGFRIADEGELKLLRQDVIAELLEREYEQQSDAFLAFSESFAPGKSDQELEDMILELFDYSMAYPWPEEWRNDCAQAYHITSEEELSECTWMNQWMDSVRVLLAEQLEVLKKAMMIAGSPDGPYMYLEALEDDEVFLQSLLQAEDYRSMQEIFAQHEKSKPLSRKRDAAVSEEKKQKVKDLRDQVKETCKKIREAYFAESYEEIWQRTSAMYPMMQELVRLTDAFETAFSEAKKEKNILDFHDLEHLALKILVEKTENGWERTLAAREYARHFEEIMIDEYQDSNLVQELLLTSVSGSDQGLHNIFMVGDVKQSIYRFRLARPDLFMEKYRTFPVWKETERLEEKEKATEAEVSEEIEEGSESADAADQIRIDLHRNFRSREQVLDSVNDLFSRMMTENLGGITYDDAAALYPGACYPEGEEGAYDTELILIAKEDQREDSASVAAESPDEEEETDSKAREARIIGQRILAMVGKEEVRDKESGQLRKAEFGDIVILLRSVTGWTEVFLDTLNEMGIPVSTGSSTGYFSALEVKTILSFLRVLDNPRQDIPLAAAMRSPIGGFTDEELALIRLTAPESDFYTCCSFCQQLSAEDLKEKMQRFWNMVNRLRQAAIDTPVHLLLWKIYEETGYLDYVSAMPSGAVRKANLEMLVEKAIAYEATSYRGLFHFVRYIENLQKYEVDYGEANLPDQQEHTVRLMSIHKSKGLEFPVVFVSGLGKGFNFTDARSRIVFHPVLGMGCDYIDPKLRVRMPLLIKRMISREIKEETLGEELRILYVALTRAKEKLILTGIWDHPEKKLEKWIRNCPLPGQALSYSALSGATGYLDWIMPVLMLHPCSEELRRTYNVEDPEGFSSEEGQFRGYFRISTCNQVAENSLWNRNDQEAENLMLMLKRTQQGETYDPKLEQQLKSQIESEYPYQRNLLMPGKMSVSELKLRREPDQEREKEEEAFQLHPEEIAVPRIPSFYQQEEETVSGAARGSIYHRFMELLDFCAFSEVHQERKDLINFVQTQLESLVNCGKIQKDEARMIQVHKIVTFLQSDLARRMGNAAKEGLLMREQPFVLGIPADQIRPEWDGSEKILVQGIIDAYFYENDDIVLMDYKTDLVEEAHPEKLVEKYQKQLDYYQMALEQLTGRRVIQKSIYSFTLGRELLLPVHTAVE